MPEQWIFRGEGLWQSRLDRAPEAKRDQVRQRLQLLRQFHITGGGLWTTMANGGDPYDLARLGLAEAVARHVGFGKSSINFLSFTESETRALEYAGMPVDRTMFRRLEEEPSGSWDDTEFVVFRFRINKRHPVGIYGVYVLEYTPGSRAYVINGSEYLSSLPATLHDVRYQDALRRSTADKEWLVTPADPIEGGQTLSALLRKCDALVADHYVPADYFPDYGSSATFL